MTSRSRARRPAAAGRQKAGEVKPSGGDDWKSIWDEQYLAADLMLV